MEISQKISKGGGNNTLKVKRPSTSSGQEGAFVTASGLKLPVRLGRVSNQGSGHRCLTNVLCKGASSEPVFFAESKFTNLNHALKNLRERLGVPTSGYRNMGFVNLKEGTQRSRMPLVANRIKKWAKSAGYDAVIWNDLPSTGVEFKKTSTGREVLPLLLQDSVLLGNTQHYVQGLPTPHNPLQNTILELEDSKEVSTEEEYQASLVADFAERDSWSQTSTPKSQWFKSYYGTWGPAAKVFPSPTVPEGVDPVQWKRDRIVEVAKHYKGLPYKRWSDGMRGHFPARGCGLDCSNFASWVYNYGLGIKFTSSVDSLAKNVSSSKKAGRFLSPGEPLKKGDLVIFDGHPKHVVIYIDENHIIDSTSGRPEGVQVRDVRKSGNKWCQPKWSKILCVRRPVE